MHLITFLLWSSVLMRSTSAAENLTVGIVGAGASGLYAAILLQSLDIDYEILEANDRPGGRILTHYFDPANWKASRSGQPEYYDYFDIGAMRLPETQFMSRLVGNHSNSLIQYINSHVSELDKLKLITYIFSNKNTFLYYNRILRRSGDPLDGDTFKTGLRGFADANPTKIWDSVINNFITTLSANFIQGFTHLSKYGQSVRQYLTSKNFSFLEINFLETFLEGTGHFDEDLTEIVLEDWLFGEDNDYTWKTIEGGMSRLIKGMEALLTKPTRYSERVIAISQAFVNSSLSITTTSGETRTYDHVINTVPLGAMQAMDMSTLNLGYAKESAIRMINYDPSMKIGIKFKSRWWQELPNPIFGGQSNSDLPIRACVYPSYGVNTPNAAAVMIASYTWGQDASRLASYLSTPLAESHLLNLTLSSLATLNNLTSDFLHSQYVDHFAYSWYNNEFSVGAFPEFGPGQFTGLMPALMTPAAGGRAHFGGDALSAGHAWIVGGLNAGFRCVREVLEAEGRGDLAVRLVEMWGPLIDIDPRNVTDGALFGGAADVTTARERRALGRRRSR